jgi:hypothetical protein
VALQRSAARGDAAEPVAPATVEATVSFQRMFSGAAEHGPAAPARPSVSPADAAVAAGVAHPAGDGSVEFDPPPGYGGSGGAPPVQRMEEAEPAPAVLAPVEDRPHPASSAAGVLPSPADWSPADLEELAARLFDPLVARLRGELWLDRERAGWTAATW